MLKKICLLIMTVIFTLLLVAFPEEIKLGVSAACETCLHSIIPSLFLFSVLSSFITMSGALQPLMKIFSPIMKVFGLSENCFYPLFLGAFSGFPIGAKTTADLYNRKMISRSEAENLLGFCNNCSPIFLMYISLGIWGTQSTGLYIYLIQLVSALVTGLIICFFCPAKREAPLGKYSYQKSALSLTLAIKNAAQSMVTVCSFVVFMSVIPVILKLLNLSNHILNPLITGFFEISTGLTSTRVLTKFSFACCCFICAFGSVSVMLQAFYFCAQAKLSVRKYIIGKLLSGVLSFFAGYFLYPQSLETFAPSYFQGELGHSILISTVFIFITEFFKNKLRKLQKNKQGRYYADRQP